MSELKEFASFVTLNMANLAATYAQLLADSNVGYEDFPTDSRVASGRKLLKAVVEVFETKTSNPLLQRFIKNKNKEYLRWSEDIDPPQPLVELECLGQTLTPVVTNLEAGKYLWRVLAEVRAMLLQNTSFSPASSPLTEKVSVPDTSPSTQPAKSVAEEERFLTLLDASPDAIVTYDPIGQVTYLNPAFEELFGWTQEELLGKRIDFVPDENLEETNAAIEQLFSMGKVHSFETRRLTKLGNLVDVEQSGAILKDKDGNVEGSIIFIRDITERKKTEEILRATEEQYRTFLEESPDPIVMYDMQGKTTYINSAFTHVFGWTSDEILGQQVDFVPEESKAETQAAIQTVFKEGRMSLESKRMTKDGRILDAWGTASLLKDNQGNPIGLLAILRDITERKQAELEREKLLAETEALYRISQILSQVNDQQKMAEAVLAEYLQVLNLPQGGVMLFNDDQTEGTLIALMQHRTLIEPGMQIPVAGNPSLEKMIATKAPIVIVDAVADPILEPVHELGYKSLLLVPIIIQDKVVGVLGADSVDEIYHFTDREVELVKTVADRVGAALENRRLLDETQKYVHREQTIREITEKMRTAANLEQLIKITTTELGQHLSAEYAMMDLGIDDLASPSNKRNGK